MKFLSQGKFLISLLLMGTPLFSQGIIIDHTRTDVSTIPDDWIAKVKSTIKLHYAHTSHGGQLTSGIERLADPSLPVYDSRLTYALQYGFLPNSTHLCIMDGQLVNDYVTPDLYWENGGDTYTKATLNAYPAINVSMWAWCRQLDDYSEAEVNDYLFTMSKLEQAYPGVTFVYMTGNAQAEGAEGYNRHLRNEQIRKFCRENNKVLFDFADLDAWYQGQKTTYFFNGTEVPKEHPAYRGDECMHAAFLSCENKGRALWWMLARIAGWNTNDCDYNRDGFVDQKDLLEKRRDVFHEWQSWIKELWELKKKDADFDGNGIIDLKDRLLKSQSLFKELVIWMRDCGFSDKRNS